MSAGGEAVPHSSQVVIREFPSPSLSRDEKSAPWGPWRHSSQVRAAPPGTVALFKVTQEVPRCFDIPGSSLTMVTHLSLLPHLTCQSL